MILTRVPLNKDLSVVDMLAHATKVCTEENPEYNEVVIIFSSSVGDNYDIMQAGHTSKRSLICLLQTVAKDLERIFHDR